MSISSSKLNRRRVLQSGGALAAASALGLGGRSGARAARGTPLPANVTPWAPRFTEDVTLTRFGLGTDNITSGVRVAAFE